MRRVAQAAMSSRALQACAPSRRCNYDGVEGFIEAEDFATGWTSHHAEQVVCLSGPEHFPRVVCHAVSRCSRSSDFKSRPRMHSTRWCRFLRGAGWRRCTTTGVSVPSRNHKSDVREVTICVAGDQEEEALPLQRCFTEAITGRLGAGRASSGEDVGYAVLAWAYVGVTTAAAPGRYPSAAAAAAAPGLGETNPKQRCLRQIPEWTRSAQMHGRRAPRTDPRRSRSIPGRVQLRLDERRSTVVRRDCAQMH